MGRSVETDRRVKTRRHGGTDVAATEPVRQAEVERRLNWAIQLNPTLTSLRHTSHVSASLNWETPQRPCGKRELDQSTIVYPLVGDLPIEICFPIMVSRCVPSHDGFGDDSLRSTPAVWGGAALPEALCLLCQISFQSKFGAWVRPV